MAKLYRMYVRPVKSLHNRILGGCSRVRRFVSGVTVHLVADWVDEIVGATLDLDNRYRTVPAVLRDPRSTGIPDDQLRRQLAERLRQNPDAQRAWQLYSYDKRWSPSPYLDGVEVGLYDAGYRDVETFDDAATACAAFILRERDWLIRPRTD